MYNNENWLQAFDKHLRSETSLTRRSCNKAMYTANAWVAWLDEHGKDWPEASTETGRQYLRAQCADLAKNTVSGKIWVLKKMYNWSREQNLIPNNPFVGLSGPRTGPRSIAYVPSIHAMARLMEQPDTTTHLGLRDRACLELLYGAGIRAQELLGIRLNCLNLKDRYVHVKGKGGKERLAIFGETAQWWLEQYLSVRRAISIGKGPIGQKLFIHRRGAMNYEMLRTMVNGYATSAGFGLISAHSLRHAFATHLYQRGVNIRVIQELLGHAHLETTTIYAHALTHEMHDLLEIHHPRGTLYESKKRALM